MKIHANYHFSPSDWIVKSAALFLLSGCLLASQASWAKEDRSGFQFDDPIANPNVPGGLEPVPFPVSDVKIYHGSQCQYVDINNVNSPEFYNNPLQFDTVGIFNQDAGSTHVVCPIVRDNASNTSGVFSTQVSINNVADREFWCEFISRDHFGQLIAKDRDSTFSGGNRVLTMAVNASVADGNYNIYCHMPQGTRIYSYRVVERLATDNNN